MFRLCAIHLSQAPALLSVFFSLFALDCTLSRDLFQSMGVRLFALFPRLTVLPSRKALPSFLPLPCRTCKALDRLLYNWRLRAHQCTRPHCQALFPSSWKVAGPSSPSTGYPVDSHRISQQGNPVNNQFLHLFSKFMYNMVISVIFG